MNVLCMGQQKLDVYLSFYGQHFISFLGPEIFFMEPSDFWVLDGRMLHSRKFMLRTNYFLGRDINSSIQL